MSESKPKLKKSLRLFDLVLFNIVAIVGLRWTAVAAQAGPFSILLWIAAMLTFFIPSALIVTELSAKMPGSGGIYLWTKKAFGDFHAFICGFFYWVSSFTYYPNLLISTAGLALYIFGTKYLNLENNSAYAGIFALAVLLFIIILNIIGLQAGKWLQNLGAFGTWIPAAILVILGITSWMKFGNASAQNFTQSTPLNFTTLSIFSALCFSFAGFELQGFMGEEIDNPKKNIPRAIFISGVAIAVTYILCTSVLLVALPANEINIVTGVPQVISKIAEKINLPGFGPIIALLMVLGALGGCGAWFSGTARIPFVFGIDHYLPSWMADIHPKWGTPAKAVIVQGAISGAIIILASLGSDLKETFNLLVDSTVIMYFIPYLYLFASFIALKKKNPTQPAITPHENDNTETTLFNFPAWQGYLGLATTLTAILLTFIPGKDVTNILIYELKLIGGVLVFLALSVIFFRKAQKKLEPLTEKNTA